jgi:hypothetical protein
MQPGLGQKPGLVIETDLLPGAVHGQAFHRIFICSLVRSLDEGILVYSNANKSTFIAVQDSGYLFDPRDV